MKLLTCFSDEFRVLLLLVIVALYCFRLNEGRRSTLLAGDLTSNPDTCNDNIYFRYPALDSLVGIATRYGLDCPGVDSLWGEIFALVRPGPGATQSPVLWVPGFLTGSKATWAWR